VGWVGNDTVCGGDGNDLLYGDGTPTDPIPTTPTVPLPTDSVVYGQAANVLVEPSNLSCDETDLAKVIQGGNTGITIQSARYIGSTNAISLFSSIDLGGSGEFTLGSGMLLTSGDGTPGSTNTSTGYSQVNNQPGDSKLDEYAKAAFSGAGNTHDASILEFTFTTVAGSANVSLDLMFGSDEYPEYSNSSFVDIAAVEVDGVNYALFNGDATQPLSVIDKNLKLGNFFDNKDGVLNIEYDGVSSPLRITGTLKGDVTEHTVRIAIADTGDSILDSGIFVSNLQIQDASAVTGIAVLKRFDDLVTGGKGNDTLYGGLGNDQLSGDAGVDSMIGGVGDDTYTLDVLADVIVENAGEGTDTVNAGFTYTLAANLENLILTGSANFGGTGNAADNVLTGNSGNNALRGLGGNDSLDGASGADSLFGGNGTDTLAGGIGNDTLDGGTGADVMAGGKGNDTYLYDDTGDTVTEVEDEGADTVQASVAYTLADHVENLTLTGTANINGAGNALNNAVTGNSGDNWLNGGLGNDTLDGGAGADSLVGGAGDDAYLVDNAGDLVTELASEGTDSVFASVSYALTGDVENLTLSGTANVNASGNALANLLVGNSGNNTLDGLAGADTMQGGAGNDSYLVDDAGDVITEGAGQGTDTVHAAFAYTLSANLEYLVLTGTADINATGNASANSLTGNGGANVLDGLAGADTMAGGAGDDAYLVDNAGDVVTEGADAGTDEVRASVSHSLGNNLENLTLTGGAAITGTGNALDNVLTGNGAASTLAGGAGDDSYVLGAAGNVISEGAGAGTDLVIASFSHTLTANVENLTLSGGGAVNGTGNGVANLITGNTGNNVLDGAGGTDTVSYAFATTQVVVNLSDTAQQNTRAGGLDTLSNFENVIGGEGNDHFIGTAGANRLDGGAGDDTLQGGAGNDTYVVDSLLDVTAELKSAGTDTVESGVDWRLGSSLENLTLTGAADIDGTGNDATTGGTGNNLIIGNGGANVLVGFGGNDTLQGGDGDDVLVGDGLAVANVSSGAGGADTLTGGAGRDYFVFDKLTSVDTITDFTIADDILALEDTVFTSLPRVAPVDALKSNIISNLCEHLDWTFDPSECVPCDRFSIGAAAVDADDRLIYNSTTGALYYDMDGTGASAQVQIAQLSAGLMLTAANFTLI
jgi:Ca2+-binding RTX toxin-like protein